MFFPRNLCGDGCIHTCYQIFLQALQFNRYSGISVSDGHCFPQFFADFVSLSLVAAIARLSAEI
jgi:hypothetical protein